MATKRKISKTELSDAWIHFLLTGQYTGLREIFPDISNRDHFDIFRLAKNSPRMRAELKKIWIEHRDEVLADWRKKKRSGLPWPEREFDQMDKLIVQRFLKKGDSKQ